MKTKIILFAITALYFINASFSADASHLIDGANLLIHEGGHVMTMFFGQFIYILGWSATQIIAPLAFAYYFFTRDQILSTSVALLWAGESTINVGVYADDAIAMQLPLVGGGGGDPIHDWNYLLSHTGLLPLTHVISFLIKTSGWVVIIFAIAMAFSYFQNNKEDTVERVILD